GFADFVFRLTDFLLCRLPVTFLGILNGFHRQTPRISPVQQDVKDGLFSNFQWAFPSLDRDLDGIFQVPAPITEPNCSPDGLCLCGLTARVQATVLFFPSPSLS